MLSVVLPVYNCNQEFKKSMPGFVGLLNGLNRQYEIIIVDDHSENGQDFLQVASEYGCIYIRNTRNEGKGESVRKGFEKAAGDFWFFMDGDFPFDFSATNALINVLILKGADVVIGDRNLEGSSYPSNLPWLRKFGSKILALIVGNIFVPGFFDTQCGLKGFRAHAGKEIFARLTRKRFSFDTELLFIARKRSFDIQRIPVKVLDQQSSTVNIMKDGFSILWGLLAISFNHLSGKYRF